MGKYSNAPVDRAAGGVLLHEIDGELRVAVVHRGRYDDWTLPKGHVDRGETWEETARREVFEEAGVEGEIVGVASIIGYWVGDEPKIVLFYPMRVVEDGKTREPDADEVLEVVWWTREEALERLTFDQEREVLADLMP